MRTAQRIATALAGVLALSVPAAPALAGAVPVVDEVPAIACDTDYFTACSGGIDLPYGGVVTPNSCIELNGGDFNACNVGNSGRGDLPYRPVPR